MDDNTIALFNETKIQIRCLVVSNPLNMTILKLARDYMSLIGQPIPYLQFGYDSLLDFLRDIPDVIQVSPGPPQLATLTPVITQNLRSLNQLIMKQKITRPRPRAQRRNCRMVSVNTYAPPRFTSIADTSNNLNSFATHNMKFFPFTPTTRNDSPSSETQYSDDSNRANDSMRSISPDSCTENKIQNWDAKSESENVDKIIMQPDLSTHITDKMRANLKELIRCFPNGMPLSFLARRYKHYFNEELNYEKLGFISALQFGTQLTDIFAIERPTEFGDFILFDATQDLPRLELEDMKFKHEKEREQLMCEKNVKNKKPTDDPIIYISNDQPPNNMMSHYDTIESLWQETKFTEGQDIKIVISETYDPTKFWFVIYHENNFEKMNKLMDDMGVFYEETQRQYIIPEDYLQPNMYVAAYFAGSWQRAYIINSIDEFKVKLFFIDYGTVTVSDKTSIRYLSKAYQDLPHQAIRGRLDYIIPNNKEKYWDLGITRYFINMTKDKILSANITEIEPENRIVWMSIKLRLDQPNSPSTINQLLVNKGYAEICPAEDCITKPGRGTINRRRMMDYLWPLFHQLENALALSFKELLSLDQCGLMQNIVVTQDIKKLKLLESCRTDIDFSNNNDNRCGHFCKRTYFREAETEEEKAWVNALCDESNSVSDVSGTTEVVAEESIEESGESSREEIIRVYNIGGHDLHCVVVNFIVYVMTEEFLKKLVPFNDIPTMHSKLRLKGVSCKHIKIDKESHEEIFTALQCSNIPIDIKDESVVHLTPLRALDLILVAFRIKNATISDDIDKVYSEETESA